MKRKNLLLSLVLCTFLVLVSACNSHIHLVNEWTITVAPTLTEEGKAEGQCECGEVLEKILPVLSDGSVWTVKSETPGTCTEEGSRVYESIYGEATLVLPKTEHTYGEWTITVKPTLEEAGEAEKVCTCGDKVTTPVAALSDETVWTVKEEVPSTCTKAGSRTYTSIYGEVTIELPLAEHVYGEWTITVKPTLEAAGEAEKVCTCGDKVTEVVPVLTNTEVWTVKEEVPSTCTKAGSRTYTSVYGEVTIELPLAEHVYGEWTITVKPTLDAAGEAEKVCTCGDKVTEVVPALSNTEVWTKVRVTEPNYNEKGMDRYESVYGTIELEVAKLVAPYDGKTYSSFCFDAEADKGGYRNDSIYIETAWHNATVSINENGVGIGESFPFRGQVEIKMVNAETGEVLVTVTPVTMVEGVAYANTEAASVYKGFVDFATGIIVTPYNDSFAKVHVWTPFEVGVGNDKAKASAWNNTLVIDYTHEGETTTIITHEGTAVLGVSLTAMDGSKVEAVKAYTSPYVYVNKGEKLLEAWAYNGTTMVAVDGLEGTYTVEGVGNVFISGFGTATVAGTEGTYKAISENVIGVYTATKYYEMTLDVNAKTATSVAPTVEVTLNGGTYGTVETKTVNKNVVIELPVLTNAEYQFKGWFLDPEFTQAVEAGYAPKENVTLYGKWAEKIKIYLHGVEAENILIRGSEGDVLNTLLPELGIEGNMIFKGWFLDETFDTACPEEVVLTAEDEGVILYAKWEELPVYYGTYRGTEVWSKHSGNYSDVTVTINENGEISGKFNGVVESYDPATQKITWKKNASDTKTYGLWFNEELGVIATHYSSQNEIGTDYYILSRAATTNKLVSYSAIDVALPGQTSSSYHARIVNMETDLGKVDFLVYGDIIYSNVVITDALGNPLTGANYTQSKSLVVKQNNEIVLAVASKGNNFEATPAAVALDKYFGIYTTTEGTVKLDGTGVVEYTVGETTTTGTYTESTENVLDVYMSSGSEYYELTVNAATKEATMVKVMVTITFVVGEGHTEVPAITTNKNVKVTLPSATEAGYVFNGWFTEATFENIVETEYVPTGDVTLYAKHSDPAHLTIVYNNGAEQEVITYSVNDIVTISRPVYEKHAFVGWYTTADFQEGTEFVSGTAIVTDTTIYGKWEEAPIYNQLYVLTEVEGTKTDGAKSSTYTRNSAKADFDPYGCAPSSSYPLRDKLTISNVNALTGELTLSIGTTAYKGYLDHVSGVIIVDENTNGLMKEVYFYNPYSTLSITSDLHSSYWNGGNIRVIEYVISETQSVTALVKDGVVTYGISVKDINGNKVDFNEAYHAETAYIYSSTEELIMKVGFNGTTMVNLDGFEGTYKNVEETLVVNGVSGVTLNGTKGTYSVVADLENTIEMYVGGEYLVATLNTVEKTYTIEKPMVDVTFETNSTVVQETINTNKNIEITLPVLTQEGYVFRGWFTDVELKVAAGSTITPSANIKLYAKWDEVVTLTIVYGNGLDNLVLSYGAGDTPVPVEPELTNNKVFDGWFNDPECVNPYTIEPITANTTIYANWMGAVVMFGEYKGVEAWGSSNNGACYMGGSKSISIDAKGNVTGTKSGLITDYNPVDGSFKLVDGSSHRNGYFNELTGVFAISYSTSSASETGLSTDVLVFVQASKVDYDKSKSAQWLGGTNKLFTISVNGVEEVIYYNGTQVFRNVTVKSNNEVVPVAGCDKLANIHIFNAEGTEVAKFIGRDGKLCEWVADGYQGTYTIEADTMVLDGFGSGTYNGETITYSYSGTQFTVVKGAEEFNLKYDSGTKTFSKLTLDVLAGLTFKASTKIAKGWNEEHEHTFTFVFDGTGNVKISFSGMAVDGWESWQCDCYPSYTGNGTYTIEGDVVTVKSNGETFVFKLDSATAPTSMSCTSTTQTTYDDGYFKVGTKFTKK